jgi:hypothetical protein
MKKIAALCCLMSFCMLLTAQETSKKQKRFTGMYVQWGYNLEAYSRSTIHFKMGNGDNFKLHKARAHDSNDFDAILEKPFEVSIPQYNYRIGFYLNDSRTKAVEINFDHTKYIVSDGQTVRVTGTIGGVQVDGDSVLDANRFLHFEHTDGANWLHINYVKLGSLLTNKENRKTLGYVWKAGAGINIPRSDMTWKGERLNNDFHIAGYNASAEAGLRYYPLKKFFIEATGKTGYVRYINALANTPTTKGSRVTHGFVFAEAIATLGFEFSL